MCLGCGQTTRRSWERRNLHSSVTKEVTQLWKATLTSALQKRNSEADVDSLVCASCGAHSEYICRMCFYAYQRILKAKAVIESNAAKVVDVFASTCSSSFLSVDAQPSTSTISDPCSERLPSRFVYTSTPEQSHSPGVAVRD